MPIPKNVLGGKYNTEFLIDGATADDKMLDAKLPAKNSERDKAIAARLRSANFPEELIVEQFGYSPDEPDLEPHAGGMKPKGF